MWMQCRYNILTQSNILQAVRRDAGKCLSKSEKSLASVQLYLYTKYLLRIEEFRYVANVNEASL